MKVALVSSKFKFKSELSLVKAFFEEGLDYFHLKKKKFSRERLEKYINEIPSQYHQRIILHNHYSLASKYKLGGIHVSSSKMRRNGLFYNLKIRFELILIRLFNPSLKVCTSFHSIQSMTENKQKYHHAFLSPVFDSLSKSNLSAAYSEAQLKQSVPSSVCPVYALGGINEHTVILAKELGFKGVALYGSIWKESSDKITAFKKINDIATGKEVRFKISEFKAKQVNLKLKKES